MRVACVAIPHFLVEVERLHEPALRERPVVVGGDRGVLDCSTEAMACGVRPGVTLREALSRCAGAAFVEAHPDRYRSTTLAIADALLELSPLIELAGPGVLYLGVDGQIWSRGARSAECGMSADCPLSPWERARVRADSAFSTPYSPDPLELELAETIVAVAEEATGLAVRVGMADGKFAAYVAAQLGDGGQRQGGRETRPPPNPLPEGEGTPVFDYQSMSPGPRPLSSVPRSLAPGSHMVPSGAGAAFVVELSVEDLPVSVEMRRRLRLFGLRTLGDLARLPRGPVLAQFGTEGERAWELAHGIDRSPLIPYRSPASITERLAFPAPVDTQEALRAAVQTLLGRALHRPAIRGRAARGLRLQAHLENGHVWEREVTFREPVGSGERMLLALWHKVETGELPAPFEEVGLTLFGLCGESVLQGNLFTVERGRQLDRVAEAARQLKTRYGRPILAKVMEVEPWSRIPERRFALIDYDP